MDIEPRKRCTIKASAIRSSAARPHKTPPSALNRKYQTTRQPAPRLCVWGRLHVALHSAVWIWETLKMVPKFKVKPPDYIRQSFPFVKNVLRFGPMSLNDVCVYIPAWFGSVATLGVFLLTHEASRSLSCATIAALVMSIIPAHLMRSIAGGYDNESIAVSAICFTFYLWVRSLRTKNSWPIAALAGLCYVYMVAAWGGYIFVINMIGVHAAALVPLRMFNSSTYKAYTLFFIIGTLGVSRIASPPPVAPQSHTPTPPTRMNRFEGCNRNGFWAIKGHRTSRLPQNHEHLP